ncbi:MAG TPA: ABC transporter ATP-binding protein, partial [Nocardioides sp.]|nr:ABC transporter ATP-binding protein [Nocardioides sp.]
EPTEGEILVDGRPVHFASPGDAIAAGIGMVHQHFMLVPVMSVADNILLGAETMANPIFLDRAEAHRRIVELGKRFGFEIDPDVKVGSLSVGWQQRVEILKALYRSARILVLDEPTAVLTPQEIDELMDIMRSLKEQGTSIVFITHKLREVKAVGDRISVIRRGKVVGTAEPTASEPQLAEMMVGREVKLLVDKASPEVGDVVLDVRGVTVVDPRGHQVVKDVSFDARAGEVLGIAGVQGNGQTELIKALLGLVKPDAGAISLEGRDISRHGPRESLDDGIGYIPEDRSHDGYVGAFSVRENLVLDLYRSGEFSRGMALRLDEIEKNADERIEQFDIRTESASTPLSSLSGGNQQKVVVAREFSRPLKVLIAAQPTRGVDVGSIEFIHKRIIEERDKGTAVIIVSTELDEIFALSDRIAVMYDGRIVATVTPDIAREDIGLMMAGAHEPAEEVSA